MNWDYFPGTRKSRKEKRLKRKFRAYKRGGKFRSTKIKEGK